MALWHNRQLNHELTEAERAAAAVIDAAVFDSEMTLVNDMSREDIARAITAAVSPIIEADALYDAADRYLDLYLDLYPEDRQYPADLLRTWAAEKHDRIKG
jgi:hypothetical protein